MEAAACHRYFMKLAYHGSGFHGWQIQENATTVQETLTKALETIMGEGISLVGCGRTDTGVHAREYYAHFELSYLLPATELGQLTFRLNRFLPREIVIFWLRAVSAELHSRFSAIMRTYRYYIHTFKDPFLSDRSWFVYPVPDLQRMNEGAALLLGYEDFTSFSKLHSAAKTNICHLTEARWEERGHRMVFTISADRFLRNMVRAIVGTLIDLGHGKINQEDLKRIVGSKNRSDAGQSVPAHGLFLEKVVYPAEYNAFLKP